jgi:hypothetical protein
MMSSARRAFLDGLVDDAGLFPPARLSMPDALDARERAGAGLAPWIVGRFVVPASRLDELRHVLESRGGNVAASVVVDGSEPIAEALESLALVTRAVAHVVALESLECALARVGPADADAAVAAFEASFRDARFPFRPAVYLEVSLAESRMERAVAALHVARGQGFPLAAKIRCGGLDPAAVPAAERIAAFLRAASDVSLPFKATAGLHHPLPRFDPNAGATTFGFLNVIGAAIFARRAAFDSELLTTMLRDEDASHFTLGDDAFGWLDHTATGAEITEARTSFVHSYGSCSLSEPIDDLRDLKMLARADV